MQEHSSQKQGGREVTCYEPVTLTYVLITVLIMAFSGELFDVFLTEHEKDCHRRNSQLQQDQKQGPIQECG